MEHETDPQSVASLQHLIQDSKEALAVLLQRVSSSESDDRHWPSHQTAEFNLWCVKVGANGSGLQSVDVRLKDVPETCEIITQLLQSLKEDLDKLCRPQQLEIPVSDSQSIRSEGGDSKSDASSLSFSSLSSLEHPQTGALPINATSASRETLALQKHVEDTIDRLHAHALQIDRAGANHRRERIQRYQQQDEPRFAHQGYKTLAIRRAKDQFPLATEAFHERIAESFARRRTRFDYLKRHQKKRAVEAPPVNKHDVALRRKEDNKVSQHVVNSDSLQHVNVPAEYQHQDLGTVYSATVRTKLEPRPKPKEKERAESVASVVVRHDGFPPPPRTYGPSFQCPYCRLEFRASEGKRASWIQHVIQDFEPYFCVVEDCATPFDVPNTFDGLLVHLQQHVAESFHVDMPDGEQRLFSENEFEDHFKQQSSAPLENIGTLKEASRRKGAFLFQMCPFCGGYPDDVERDCADRSTPEAQTKLRQHIKTHFLHVALFLPPYREDIFENDEEGPAKSDFSRRGSDLEDVGNPEDYVTVCGRDSCDCERTDGNLDSDASGDRPSAPDIGTDFWGSLGLTDYDPIPLTEEYCRNDEHLRTLARAQEGIVFGSSKEANVSKVGPDNIVLTRERLDEALVSTDPYHEFLPSSSLKQLTTKDIVTNTLNRHKMNLETNISKLTAFICGENGATKIFANLVWIGEVEKIEEFYKYHVIDDMLPLHWSRSRSEQVRGASPNREIRTGVFSSPSWNILVIDMFCQGQWLFLAPTFRQTQFRYSFSKRCPMPFLERGDIDRKETYFSSVEQRTVYRSHIDMVSDDRISLDDEGHPMVAIKHVGLLLSSKREVDLFVDALELTRKLAHPHLIKVIAYYNWDNDHYVMSPWASGGNLRDLWMSEPPTTLDEDFIAWAFKQFTGLAEAIKVLHSEFLLDWNVKAENILCFGDRHKLYPITRRQPELVLDTVCTADFRYFQMNPEVVSPQPREKANAYEAPEAEAEASSTQSRSRKRDVQSIRYVYLQFLIWILYGKDELRRFQGEVGTLPGVFFERSGRGEALFKNDIQKWLDWIQQDPRCTSQTALRQLLDLICARLLIPRSQHRASRETVRGPENSLIGRTSTKVENVEDRASAQEMEETLRKIREDALNPGSKVEWMDFQARNPGGPGKFGDSLATSSARRRRDASSGFRD